MTGAWAEKPRLIYDHTAPWRCSEPGCKTCHYKPTYAEWARTKKETK